MIDLHSTISFEEEEWGKIHNLVATLEPVKLAAEALCRRDATLLTADTTISFMINNLGTTDLAVRLKESLSRRINERRTNASSLLQYLHKRKQDYGELELDSSLKFERLSKSTIISMITHLSKHRDSNLPSGSESESDADAAENVDRELTMKEKLNRAINKEVNSTFTPQSRTVKDVANVIKKELAIFEVEGNRGKNLQRCYDSLLSIPPASVESERVFSGCGKLGTKIRSLLNDESLDILCFLRTYFKLKAETEDK